MRERYFELFSNDISWQAELSDDINKQFKIKENYPFINHPIPLELKLHLDEGQDDYVKDVYYWGHNIVDGSTPPPKGLYIIFSKKVESILLKFLLPNHNFFKVDLKGVDIDYNEEYSVLRIESFYHLLNFTKVKFTEWCYYPKKKIKEFERGEISSFDEFNKIRSNLDKMNDIAYDKLVFDKPYDVFYLGSYIVSEKVKKALEEAGCTNIRFQPYEEEIEISQ